MGRTKPKVNSEYIAGLTDGEGCFYVNIWNTSSYQAGAGVQMHFHLKMQEKDKPLLERVRNTLECGEVYFQKETRANHCQCYRYTVSSGKDIRGKIIPFFQKHQLQSVSKQENFKIFCKIALLVEKGEHLKKNGLLRIRKLKAKMNKKTIGLA